MTTHFLIIYLLVGFCYGMIYGCVNLSSAGEALFVGLFWPLDVLRAIAVGARSWWC